MRKSVISTDKAPGAVGPYSQAIRVGDLLFVSGQIPLDPKSGEMVGSEIQAQTRQALENLKAILESVGADMTNLVKTTVFITNMEEFPLMNEIYASFFESDPPARACVEVSNLPKGALVEIEAVALI